MKEELTIESMMRIRSLLPIAPLKEILMMSVAKPGEECIQRMTLRTFNVETLEFDSNPNAKSYLDWVQYM